MIDAAQGLGREIAVQPGSTQERVTTMFRRCVTRPPTTEEQSAIVAFYEKQKERIAQEELEAKTLSGEKEGDVEKAAWTTVARALLNLDEAITRQ